MLKWKKRDKSSLFTYKLLFKICSVYPLQEVAFNLRVERELDLFGVDKHKFQLRGVLAVEQHEIENTYRQEKDEKLLKFLVLFFLTSTAFEGTNAYSEMFCFRKT